VWAVLAIIGLIIAESAIVTIFDPDPDSGGGLLAIQGLVAVNLVGVAFGFASVRESPFVAPARLGLRGFAPSALGIAALAYLAYIVFAAIYAPLFSPEQEDVTRDLGVDEGGVAAVAAGVLIVGVAPFSEEVFFRGFMYGGLRRRMPVWAAAGISGLIFGLLHYTGPDSLAVVPQLAVLGILLAWLYERTGSLWLPIMLHVVNNAIAFAILAST
jgi:membrane protease YdiL (CAAX protease family)